MPKRVEVIRVQDQEVTKTIVSNHPNGHIYHKICKPLLSLITPLSELTLDPLNARIHPERNMEAIKHSLDHYGQTKPIVVRAANRVIIAGNGTYEAVRQLGWTHIAASIVDLTEVEAMGFGLADNRTAELARWDYETVSVIEGLLTESGEPVIGWEEDELFLFRSADFIPPKVTDDNVWTKPDEVLAISGFTKEQMSLINQTVETVIRLKKNTSLSVPSCIEVVVRNWLGIKE